MQWNLRGTLVGLLVVATAAAGVAFALSNARGKRGAGTVWSVERAIRALPGYAPARGNEKPPDRVEATPVLALPQFDMAMPFRGADVLLLDSESPYVRPPTRDLAWAPPRERLPQPRLEPWWVMDLWDYKFPAGDLILNPEVLDSIRPPE